ncbi:hypothetical protein [Desulfotomaculum sp. 1211_IL3151]
MADMNWAGLKTVNLSGEQMSLLGAAQAEINTLSEDNQKIILIPVIKEKA